MIDKIISHYKVIDKLGEGGMGVLYLAEDLELNRKAVLKFLPPDMINDPETNLRFKREAQSAGSLSHPNIVTIYDVGVHENKTFIAMEYVEGKSLRDVIKNDQITIEKITDISVQICEGLNEAHSKGITHRDIKPENILIDEKGKVKIVDFGLAKIKNVNRGITKQDSTVGTLKYMSPEQIRNQNVDHRSDIWSFGMILYEMLTGKYPFKGEHDASLFYSIINQSPEPLARYKSNISEGFQRVIDKSLDKDSATRYQHIDELLSDLRREKKESGEFNSDKKRTKKSKIKNSIIIFALALLVICTALILYLLNNPTKNVKPPKHTQLTFDGNIYDLSEISPDGQFTAYVTDSGNKASLFVKDNFGEKSFEIFAGMNWITSLRWSPIGNELLIFTSIDTVPSGFIIPKLGGKARPVKLGFSNCWSPDGKFLASIYQAEKDIYIKDKNLNEIVKTIKLDGDYDWFIDLDWSFTGNRFVCLTVNEKRKKHILWTIRSDGSEQQKVTESEQIFSPRWSQDGNLYYLQESDGTRNLMKIEVSSDGTTINEPKVVITGLDAYKFSLTKDNRLAFTKNFIYSNLWELKVETWKTSFQTQKLTSGTMRIKDIELSPDGKEIAYVSRGNIFINKINEKRIEQLTFLKSKCYNPSWNPGGNKIACTSGSDIILISSGGQVEKIIKNINMGSGLDWETDSTIFIYKKGNRNFYIYNIKTDKQKTLLKNENLGYIFFPRISTDGEDLVVFWNRIDGNAGLWIISIVNSEQIHLLYSGDTIIPLCWSQDNRYIYAHLSDTSELIKISVENGDVKNKFKIPFDNIERVEITPDGKKIFCLIEESTTDVWMIENFDPDVE